MQQFFIVAAAKSKKAAEKPKAEHEYDASFDLWHSMAYSVAKELGVRPIEILKDWTCEELLVAFGVYANQNQSSYYDLLSKKERRLKRLTPLDRWALPFVTSKQLSQLSAKQKQQEAQLDDMDTIAKAMFG